MGRLIETVGKYAQHPYYVAQTDTSVYCVEELCFTLCQNTFLLDRGLLDMKLAKWLEEECGLKELARPLYTLISQNGSPSAFVGLILEYAHFGTEKKRQETEEVLRVSADMDAGTRRKHFADYLARGGHYAQALAEYEKVMEEIPSMNRVMRSELLYNKGVAFCRLFSFQEAAEAFLASFQENPEHGEAAAGYLGALRMSLSEEEYIAFIADNPMWHEQSLEVEGRMEACRIAYEGSDACRKLEACLGQHDAEYYGMISEKLIRMQRDYRKMVEQR